MDRQKTIDALANVKSYSLPTVNPQQMGQQSNQGFFQSAGKSTQTLGATALKGILGVPGKIFQDIRHDFNQAADSFTEMLTGARSKELVQMNLNSEALDQRKVAAFRQYNKGQLTQAEYKQALKDIVDEQKSLTDYAKATQSWADPSGRAQSVSMALLTPLAFGKLKAFSSGKNAALKLGQGSNFAKATIKLEAAAEKNPVLRRFLQKNASNVVADRAMGEMFKQGSKELAMSYFVRYPIYVGQNVRETRFLLQDIVDSDMKGAMWHGALLGLEAFNGGPLGAVLSGGQKLARATKQLTFAQKNMFDLIGEAAKWDEGFGEMLTRLKTSNPKLYAKYEASARGMQAINMRMFDDNPYDAAAHILSWMETARPGVKIQDLGAEGLMKWMHNYYETFSTVVDNVKLGKIKGIDPEDWDKITIGVMDTQTKKALVQTLESVNKSEGIEGMQRHLEQLQADGVQWTQNEQMFNTVKEMIGHTDFAKRINKFDTGRMLDELKMPPKLKKEISKAGYFINRPQKIKSVFVASEDAPKLVSKFAKNNDDFVLPEGGLPGLNIIGAALERMGLSPQQTGGFVQTSIKNSFARHLEDADELKGLVGKSKTDAKVIISKLQRYAEDVRPGALTQKLVYGTKYSPVHDIRLLTKDEVMKALTITEAEATAVQRALNQAYLDIPLALRGFGERIQDFNMAKNPLASIYARIQSTYRYAYNPFFRTQEITETAIISGTRYPGINTIRGIFGFGGKPIKDTVKLLETKGLFGSQYSGEAAADQLLGKLSANISRPQKEALAGVAMTIAKKKGVSVEELLTQNSDEIADALRIVVQYPKKSVLNSALARTLNIAFFPSRYNLKVARLAAETIAQLPPAVQLGVIKSTFEMTDWLQSPEGMAWQSEHAEAIGIFKWLTPIGNLEWTYKILSGKVHAPSDLGLLGGLPFGMILQGLDSQLENFNLDRPYVKPSTGEVMPDWIPQTLKAQAATAVTDLLTSLYSFPGRTLGLTGKGELTRGFVSGVLQLDPDSDEFKKKYRFEDLTEEQWLFIQTVQQIQNGKASPGPSLYLPPLAQIAPRPKLSTKKAPKGRAGKKTARPFEGADALEL